MTFTRVLLLMQTYYHLRKQLGKFVHSGAQTKIENFFAKHLSRDHKSLAGNFNWYQFDTS